MIAMNLSDGTACYGKPIDGKPGKYWLRRTRGEVYEEYDSAASRTVREQAESALKRGWAIGEAIEVEP